MRPMDKETREKSVVEAFCTGCIRTAKLIDKGTIVLENNEWIGQASDGVWVRLGDSLDGCEAYLALCPSPCDW